MTPDALTPERREDIEEWLEAWDTTSHKSSDTAELNHNIQAFTRELLTEIDRLNEVIAGIWERHPSHRND